ncbi:hypothetical protein [Saccharomonospora iraqiensis]|uniref:hypothetical protein n=1 Tax=Saccharomonospora iraqiensis TaxID=52698 RepID=UPI0004200457|nr:hypothetical protein [Saccharomonospora iraqiensis]
MGDDVSTRFSDDDGNDRVPPEPGSRMRVLAVMGAVVVGCGISAVTVGMLPGGAEPRIGTRDADPSPTVPAVPDGGAGHTYLVPTDGGADDTGTDEPEKTGDSGGAPGRGGGGPDDGENDPDPRDDGADGASPTPTRDDPPPTTEPPEEPPEPADPPPDTGDDGGGDDGGGDDGGDDEDDGCLLFC